MSLDPQRHVYGVHSFTPYARDTGEYKGIIKVLDSSSLALEGELVKLNGGSQKYPWAIEEGLTNATVALKVSEYPDFLFELFAGNAPTSNLGAAASTTAITNRKGTSAVDASTGMVSVAVAAADDVKFAKYVVVVLTATTVDVFAASDIDFRRGADLDYENDLLKITDTPLTVPNAGTVAIPNTGIEITGSAAVAMTPGDTAIFETLPAGDEMSVKIGSTIDEFPEFGAILVAKKRSDDSLFQVELFRCKGSGLPIAFEINAWSQPEINVEAFYDIEEDAIAKIYSYKSA